MPRVSDSTRGENMLKETLQNKEHLRKYLFRRGYLLTNRSDIDLAVYPFYGNWSSKQITQKFYLYIHNEQHFYTYSKEGIHAALIGHAYNPFSMKTDETEILADCINAYQKRKRDFFEAVRELTGIHLIAIFDQEKVLFVQDCSGMMMCNYGFCRNNLYITSNSAVIEDIDKPKKNEFVEKLLKSKSYRRGSKYLPGDLTPYEGICRLGPNLSLTYQNNRFTVARFYPYATHPEVDETNTQVSKEIAGLIKNSVALCAQKWEKPAISLSGGVDSRTTLSGAVGNYDKFFYYSFHSKPQEVDDANAAHNICTEIGVHHEIYPISDKNEDYEDFAAYREIITHNSAGVSTPKDHEIRKYIFLSKLDTFQVELKSWASEIGRAFWERRYGIKLPTKLHARHLSIFQTRYFAEPSLLRSSDEAYRDFMRKSSFIYPMYNYENSDIFYWEYRFGSWGTIVTTGQNIFNFEVTMPMNNRKIMDMFLWYPHLFRRMDQVNRSIMQHNNPRLLEAGNRIHNDYLGKKRQLLESMYYYYRTLFYFQKR